MHGREQEYYCPPFPIHPPCSVSSSSFCSSDYPTTNGGMQNGSSVGIHVQITCTIFARFVQSTCMLSRCLLTKFLHRSSVGSVLRVRCWLGTHHYSGLRLSGHQKGSSTVDSGFMRAIAQLRRCPVLHSCNTVHLVLHSCNTGLPVMPCITFL